MKIQHLNIIRRLWNQKSGIAQRRLALKKEQKIEEATMDQQVHRVMVTVSDPHHTMQTQRKTKIMKRVKVKANDKDHAIDSALHHYKKAGYKVHDHEYLGRVHEEVEFVEALSYNHHDNRTGFGKRPREDDEYHVPDPTTTTHKVVHTVSKDGGEKHNREVTISNTTKTREQAKAAARAHLEKQGYKIHEEVELDEAHKLGDKVIITKGPKDVVGKTGHVAEIRHGAFKDATKTYTIDHDGGSVQLHSTHFKKHISEEAHGPYEKSLENLRSANAAKKHGDMFAHNLHMADHHDNLAQWHGSKGRHGEADRHAEKSDQYHEKAMKLKEEVAANNVGDGNIAGTKGDAGKKAVMTKEPLKRKLMSFKEACDCWKGYKRKPGTKPCEKGSCVKEDNELEEAAIDAKGHKSSTGGLTQKGRDYYNNKTGGNLKAPVTTPPSKLDPDSKAAKRRKSFCARMSGVDGPMKDEKGRPTRKALALRKWNC